MKNTLVAVLRGALVGGFLMIVSPGLSFIETIGASLFLLIAIDAHSLFGVKYD